MKKWLEIFRTLYAQGTGWKWILGVCGAAYIFNMDKAPDIGRWTMMIGATTAVLMVGYSLLVALRASIITFRHQKEASASEKNDRDAKRLIHICTAGVGVCVAMVLFLNTGNTVGAIAFGFAAFFATRIVLRLAGRL